MCKRTTEATNPLRGHLPRGISDDKVKLATPHEPNSLDLKLLEQSSKQTTYEMFRDRLHAGAWGTGGREVSEERRLPEGLRRQRALLVSWESERWGGK